MSSIPRHLDPRNPQPQKQPSRDSLRSLARSHMSHASGGGGDESDGAAFQDAFQIPRLPSSPARLDVELPEADLDLTIDFNSILAVAEPSVAEAAAGQQPGPELDKVQKRASNVMRLTEQNEKLKAELRAMTERLEAAERRQQELARAQAQRGGQGQYGGGSGGAGQREAGSGSTH
ncbi:hypothetical protein BC628DRAFT_1415864 [Trametes gibbosa]|nr:hypothetical protein BC628DRAFT_1415864 [Trametes gibbosa]